jgi:hypothetical protein
MGCLLVSVSDPSTCRFTDMIKVAVAFLADGGIVDLFGIVDLADPMAELLALPGPGMRGRDSCPYLSRIRGGDERRSGRRTQCASRKP